MPSTKRKSSRVMGIMPASERDWQAESDLDTLLRARQIRQDKKRFAAAQRVADERLKGLASVSGEGDGD